MTVRLLHVPFCELHRRSVAPNVAYRPRKNVQIKVPALLAGGSLSKEARILETDVEKTDIEKPWCTQLSCSIYEGRRINRARRFSVSFELFGI